MFPTYHDTMEQFFGGMATVDTSTAVVETVGTPQDRVNGPTKASRKSVAAHHSCNTRNDKKRTPD